MPYCQECGEQFNPKFPGATHCYMCYALLNQDKLTKPQKVWLIKKMDYKENKEDKSLFGISNKEMGIFDKEQNKASFSKMTNLPVAITGEGVSDQKHLWKSPFNSNSAEYYKYKIAQFLYHKSDRRPFKIQSFRKSVNSSI